MSDGNSRGTPNGQAPPTANGASAVTGRNGHAEELAPARTRGAAESDTEITRPQPAVRSQGPAGPARPTTSQPDARPGNPAKRPGNPAARPANPAARSASPWNGAAVPPARPATAPARPPSPANGSAGVPTRPANPADRPVTPAAPGRATGDPEPAKPVGPKEGTAGSPPIWQPTPETTAKPTFWDRVAGSLGISRKSDRTGAGPEPAAPAAATTGFTPAAAAPQTSPALAAPTTSSTPTTAAPKTAPSQGAQGLTTGAPLPPRVAPGAPVFQPAALAPAGPVAPKTDDLVVKDPTTQTLPVVPGPAPRAAAPPEASAAGRTKAGLARRTRKARLRLSRLDPWSVMKTSFLFSIAAGIMLVVAVYAVWAVLNTSGLFDSVNEIVKSVVSTPGDTTPFRIQEYVNTQKVMGISALIACVDVVIFTALATLGSFLYNLAATMLGGLEVTLAED